MKKHFYFCLFALLSVLGQQVNAQSGTIGDSISWTLQNEVLTISGECAMPDINYYNYPWYNNRSSIKQLVVKEGIRHIGNNAFENCDALNSVALPNSLTTIGNNAFYSCDALNSVALPNSLTTIGEYSFYNCIALSDVTFGSGLESIGYGAFYNCDALNSVALPNSLTTIGEYSFYNCNALSNVTFGSGLESIGNYAFYNCDALNSITINAIAPPVIAGNTFDNSSSIYIVNVPAGSGDAYKEADVWKNYFIVAGDGVSVNIALTEPGTLGDKVLAQVENLADVNNLTVSGSLNSDDFYNIKNRMTGLVNVDLSGVNVQQLDANFFEEHNRIRKVVLPNTLKAIPNRLFYNCYILEEIGIPTSVTSIGEYAFYQCESLPAIEIHEGVTTLGRYAFCGCKSLESVKFPSTLAIISDDAFYNCTQLKDVEFVDGLTHINSSAFNSCAIESIKCPSTLYYIGGNAFSYNSALSEIEFNDGLYQIADNAFYDCDALTEVTLPATLVLANASPFDYCDNLKKVTCLSIEPPYMQDQIPYGCSMEGRELYVPAISLNVYKQTVGWDKFATIKPIDYLPQNITVLGNHKLALPDVIPSDYKPSVSLIHDKKGTSYWNYGSLVVNGSGVLSMSSFYAMWDPNYQYDYSNRIQNYCSLINNATMRADNVTIEICVRNNRWMFLSFPFDVMVSDIEAISEGTTNWVIRRYDGEKRAAGDADATWVKMSSDEMLNAGEGYIMQCSRYVGTSSENFSSFYFKAINNTNKNKIFANSDVTVTLDEFQSEFIHNRSWNLIGNPYPSYYDTRFMDFSAPITVWNMNNNTYTAYSPVDDSYILLPGEAFFVQCPVDNKNIIFDKEGRQTDRTARTIEAAARVKASGTAVARTIVNLTISDGTNSDKTRIVLNNNAAMQYEMDKDASKFMSSDATVPQIYSTNEGIEYAINERPIGAGIVELSTRINVDGVYIIALGNQPAEYNVYLLDKKTGAKVSLAGNEYSFTAQAGETPQRFSLLFENNGTTGIYDIDTDNTDDESIYNLNGVKVEKPLNKGIYIQNGKKIIVK